MRARILWVCFATAVSAPPLAGACGARTLAERTDAFSTGGASDAGATGGRGQGMPGWAGSDPGSGATGSGGQGSGCSFPMSLCDGACVDISRDPSHCGGCYAACAFDESCVGGFCQPEGSPGGCLPNETNCPNWGCIDLSSNAFACGSCDAYCGNGEQCIGGICQYGTCLNGGTFCESPDGYPSCVTDFSWDWSNCGTCGNQCGDFESCENGQCVQPSCDDYCVGSDPAFCNYDYCPQSGCTDVLNDISNCGGCEQTCTGSASVFSWEAHICENGTCSCSPASTPCGSGCSVRFSYCPPEGYTGSAVDLCNTQARNASDSCGCAYCLDEVVACSGDAGCINAMDCTLASPCFGCFETFYSCADQWGEDTNPLADALVACLNQNCG